MTSGLSDERVLKKLIEQMNTGLPAKRISLSALLEEKDPGYLGRDGRDYAIDRTELLLIKDALLAMGLNDVKIPILMFSDTSQEKSAWRVEGREECAVISYVLGRSGPEVRDPLYLYLAHMSIIRRKLPTATVSVFV